MGGAFPFESRCRQACRRRKSTYGVDTQITDPRSRTKSNGQNLKRFGMAAPGRRTTKTLPPISRQEGITRARLTQVLGFLRLAPEIQEKILTLPALPPVVPFAPI